MDTPGRSQPKPTRIAVLLLASAQLLDVSPIDLFSMLTHEYLTACRLPGPLVAGAIPSEIIYVSEAGSSSIVECTASAGLRVNASISDTIAAPGQTDILLIPGPDPSTIPGELVKAFIKAHAEKGTIVMTVCTGVFPAAYAGVLEGKRATGPRALLSDLKTKFPGTKWEDKRWVHDGNIWCSGEPFCFLRHKQGRRLLTRCLSWYYERIRHGCCLCSRKLAWAHSRGGVGYGRCGRTGRAVWK